MHTKLENWVDAKAIAIDGYHPQLLGKTDDEAAAGFSKRMDGLIAFSIPRTPGNAAVGNLNQRAGTRHLV